MNKITLVTAEIKKIIGPMSIVVNSNTVLPILESGLFEIANGVLKITVTDLESFLFTKISLGESDKAKSFMFPLAFKLFKSFVYNCEAENFTMEYSKSEARVRLATIEPECKVGIPVEEAENFVKQPLMDGVLFNFATQVQNIIPFIKTANLFSSNDDLRPAMTGVFLTMFEDYLTVVATDAHRLYRKKIIKYNPGVKMDWNPGYILPQKCARIVTDLYKGKGYDVTIAGNDTHLRFVSDDYTLICRRIDERFPDWSAVWPAEIPYSFIAKRKQVKAMLDMLTNFSNKSTNQIKFDLSSMHAIVSSGDVDFDFDAKYKLPIYETYQETEGFCFALNAKFLRGSIALGTDENIKVQYASATKAFIVDNDILIMPLMVND